MGKSPPSRAKRPIWSRLGGTLIGKESHQRSLGCIPRANLSTSCSKWRRWVLKWGGFSALRRSCCSKDEPNFPGAGGNKFLGRNFIYTKLQKFVLHSGVFIRKNHKTPHDIKVLYARRVLGVPLVTVFLDTLHPRHVEAKQDTAVAGLHRRIEVVQEHKQSSVHMSTELVAYAALWIWKVYKRDREK